jgi:hypothetical protein
MKIPGILLLIFLAACSSQPTLEELEAEAATSGDWTAVEKRERMIERMSVQTESVCRDGYIYYCRLKGAQEICTCEPSRGARF